MLPKSSVCESSKTRNQIPGFSRVSDQEKQTGFVNTHARVENYPNSASGYRRDNQGPIHHTMFGPESLFTVTMISNLRIPANRATLRERHIIGLQHQDGQIAFATFDRVRTLVDHTTILSDIGAAAIPMGAFGGAMLAFCVRGRLGRRRIPANSLSRSNHPIGRKKFFSSFLPGLLGVWVGFNVIRVNGRLGQKLQLAELYPDFEPNEFVRRPIEGGNPEIIVRIMRSQGVVIGAANSGA